MIEDEEFLEALNSIDDEKVKNIILAYVENLKNKRTLNVEFFANDLEDD